MIFSSPPPQFGQVCMSMSNTRLSSRAQLMRPDRNWMGSASHAVATTASLACWRRLKFDPLGVRQKTWTG
jgi:hypothetical protein